MNPLALRLYDVLRQVRILGPDEDGLYWIVIENAGTSAMVSVPAKEPAAQALASWRAEAASALAAAELGAIQTAHG